MVINPVSSSSAAVTATQAVRPQQEVTEVQPPSKTSSDSDSDNAVKAAQAPAPRPTVNTSGQTVGTLVNVTA